MTWADSLEAWSTFGAAIVALAAAAATIWLLIHQIAETKKARGDAHKEWASAAEDRELARQDRELALNERRDAEKAQARMVVFKDLSLRDGPSGDVLSIEVATQVVNYSSGPIFDLHVGVLALIEEPYQDIVDEPKRTFHTVSADVLGPSEPLPINKLIHTYISSRDGRLIREMDLVLSFIDGAGRAWRRVGNDQPVRILDYEQTLRRLEQARAEEV